MAAPTTTTTVSAPGKVMVCGGYLVLERHNVGLVVGINGRFYTSVSSSSSSSSNASVSSEDPLNTSIVVESPQFGTTLRYRFSYRPSDRSCQLTHSGDGEDSPFIRYALWVSLSIISGFHHSSPKVSPLANTNLHIKLQADNPFYSQLAYLSKRGIRVSCETLRQVPRWNPDVRNDQGQIGKTGLGSSACLVSSLVGSLLQHFGVVQLPSRGQDSSASATALEFVHRVAQLCHCVAQGKVGSGFDVCTAVYGGCVYVRFSEAVLKDAVHLCSSSSELHSGNIFTLLSTTIEHPLSDGSAKLALAVPDPWDHSHDSFRLPAPLTLALADINQGSSTPGMVAKVLKWKAAVGSGEGSLWARLGCLNQTAAELFQQLSQLATRNNANYMTAIQTLSTAVISKWDTLSVDADTRTCLQRIHAIFQDIRVALKTMGQQCGADIEPDAQSRLIEATLHLPGVIAAGVPGAGGFDAVFAIVLGAEARGRVENFWLTYRPDGSTPSPDATPVVCPLLLQEEAEGMLVEQI